MNHTVYTVTGHCTHPKQVIRTLQDVGLGRGAVIDECRKIASVNGPERRRGESRGYHAI